MPKVYVASSAAKEMEGHATINLAVDEGFAGVQLYLDKRYRQTHYRLSIVDYLTENPDLGIMWHLTNEPDENELVALRELHEALPESRALIHHLPAKKLPRISGLEIGWENSISRVHRPDHIEETLEMSRRDNTFFVYDFGRSFSPAAITESEQLAIINYIKELISRLNPDRDVLHAADKRDWQAKFSENQVAIGRGVTRSLVSDLKGYQGVIILEHEYTDLAIESLNVLRG